MYTLDFCPLKDNVVTLRQTKRGQIKRFLSDMMINRWHQYEFEISEDDARVLFREMKRAYKSKKYPAQIGIRVRWFIYVQAYAHPLLRRDKQTGRYILQINSYRNI